jgi:hypothetical protein
MVFQKIAQKFMSGLRQYRFRMELDAFDHILPVPDTHDHPFGGPGRDFQFFLIILQLYDQGMIPSSRKRIGQAVIDRSTVMIYQRAFTVCGERRMDYPAAVHIAYALMAETDSQQGYFTAEIPYYVVGNAGFQGGTRTGRDDDMRWIEFFDFLQGDFVVAIDHRLIAQFAQILCQVIDKGIIVVYYYYHFTFPSAFNPTFLARKYTINHQVFDLVA